MKSTYKAVEVSAPGRFRIRSAHCAVIGVISVDVLVASGQNQHPEVVQGRRQEIKKARLWST
jgi:hypothetical protein